MRSIERWSKNIPIPEPTAFITKHSGSFNGKRVDYTVSAGETYLKNKEGKPKAAIFTFAYTKTNLADGEIRPVTYVWNGGPWVSTIT